MSAPIVDIRWHEANVSAKTRWSFVALVDGDGRTGWGEATLFGQESEMARALDAWRPAIAGCTPEQADLAPLRDAAATRAQFAAVSALDQALHDLRGRRLGCSVAELLGERRRDRITAYANVNRSIVARTPEGFATQARAAVDAGFDAIKIAPFDGVELYGDDTLPSMSTSVDAGLARIAAVRDAIGASVDLMVDCHWRLNRAAAEAVIRATEPFALYWLECPLPETPEFLDALRSLRSLANDRGTRLAGCETMSRVAGFMPCLRAGCYDVMMPDVKYAGGLHEMLAIADAMQAHHVAFSPHNPTGPVCHAASLQVCAIVPQVERLEMQFRETPWFDGLAGNALPQPVAGTIEVPRTPGLGVTLDAAALATLA
jgi:galactonate dehydratase